MKLAYMIMILVVLQVTIITFDGLVGEDSYTLDPYNSSTSINNTENTVWNFILNPTGWEGSNLLIIFASLVGLAGAIGIGIYLYTKSDTVLLFGFFTTLLGFGSIPIISLYNVWNRNIGMWGCSSAPCAPSIIGWALTGGLLAIFYVLACYDAWTGRNTS